MLENFENSKGEIAFLKNDFDSIVSIYVKSKDYLKKPS